MEKVAYINNVSAYLPNSPIANEDMEDYIGKIGGNPSRVRSIVLSPSLTGIIIFHKFSVCFEGFRFAKYLIISRSVF